MPLDGARQTRLPPQLMNARALPHSRVCCTADIFKTQVWVAFRWNIASYLANTRSWPRSGACAAAVTDLGTMTYLQPPAAPLHLVFDATYATPFLDHSGAAAHSLWLCGAASVAPEAMARGRYFLQYATAYHQHAEHGTWRVCGLPSIATVHRTHCGMTMVQHLVTPFCRVPTDLGHFRRFETRHNRRERLNTHLSRRTRGRATRGALRRFLRVSSA